MHRLLPLLFLAWLALSPAAAPDAGAVAVGADDWPWWRGPTRNGIAAAGQKPPLKWSETENVLWKVPVPGRGHGSPTVVGGHVYLATAETSAGTQSVLCFDRQTGKQLWQTVVHQGGLPTKGNSRASLASSSVACDGSRLFINFLNGGAVHTTALDRSGKQLWQTKIADYVIHQGYGSSPAVYGPLVIVSADNKGGKGVVAGLDRRTGQVVWKQPRPKTPNYSSPIVLPVAGRDQLVMTGCDLVAGLDPLSGKKLWQIKGATTECVTSTVTDGQRIFTSGGYPKNHISAVRADGSGKVDWENGTRVYVPSLLVHDGRLYGVMDAGVSACWDCATGKELWRHRLKGSFSASPVLVGDVILATNESGRTFVFKASPEGYTQLGENQVGGEMFASPVVCGSRIYLRVASTRAGKRQETLFCIAAPEGKAAH